MTWSFLIPILEALKNINYNITNRTTKIEQSHVFRFSTVIDSLGSAVTHLLSAFLCRCNFRYQSSRLFLGKKSETASARSCHPWISTYCAGLVLQSKMVEVEWPCVSGGLWEVEAVDCASAFSPLPFAAGLCVSQVKSDCVAQRRSCCNGMLAYYYGLFVLYTLGRS